jgi:hypothetical protein
VPPGVATIAAVPEPWLVLRPPKKALDLLLIALTGPLAPTPCEELAAALSSAAGRFGVTATAFDESASSNALGADDAIESDEVLSSGVAALTFLEGPKNEVMSRLDMMRRGTRGMRRDFELSVRRRCCSHDSFFVRMMTSTSNKETPNSWCHSGIEGSIRNRLLIQEFVGKSGEDS